MRVFVLGLDGATWDVLDPLIHERAMPCLADLRRRAAWGTLDSVFPPLSPVAWTAVMTGKNAGKTGVFEFLEHAHDPLKGRVNSSRAIRSELVWEIAGRHGKATVAGGVPMSYPPRPAPGFQLGDFLSPAGAPDFSSDPALFAELERAIGPYRPWSTAVHDGGNEAKVLDELTAFLEHHLAAIEFLMGRCPWDLFVFDLMATDRFQHELWHVWDLTHRVAHGRESKLSPLRPKLVDFWKRLDAGIGRLVDRMPADTSLILMSDHGFGPIEWYVNFNVWLLERGDLALQDSFYVRQKRWCYERGVTPEAFYKLMAALGLARQRVGRFQGKQAGILEQWADSGFLSRRHVDWSKTRAYAQGNFGQINLNLKGREPQGCVDPSDARPLMDDLKAALRAIPHPETGDPLVEKVYEAAELYHGPHEHLAPDLTVVLSDWSYRTIGLHDFTTNKVISPAFGPTGDHRLEGIFLGIGPAFRAGAKPSGANLFDIAPTLLHLLGVPVPSDMDGRILTETLDPAHAPDPADSAHAEVSPVPVGADTASPYSEAEDAEIQQRLADLGYL